MRMTVRLPRMPPTIQRMYTQRLRRSSGTVLQGSAIDWGVSLPTRKYSIVFSQLLPSQVGLSHNARVREKMQCPSWTANHSSARGTTDQSGAWEPASGWQCCDAKSCNLDNMNYADCDSPWTGICPHRQTLGPGLWLVSARQCWTVIGWVRPLREPRRGVTFILQELRSPGGLIVRFIAWILQKMRNVKRRWTKELNNWGI